MAAVEVGTLSAFTSVALCTTPWWWREDPRLRPRSLFQFEHELEHELEKAPCSVLMLSRLPE
jgi:hypothetical protein